MTEKMKKAVILARGLGTRMRKDDGNANVTGDQAAIADQGVKAMIPIDRPFLDYVMHALAESGYEKICLVIGPEHDAVRDYYNSIELTRLTVDFAIQAKPLGTADAVAAAQEFAGNDPFLVINSDNYYPVSAFKGLRNIDGPGLIGFTRDGLLSGGNIPADRINAFAIIKTDSEGFMERIVEKPDDATIAAMPEPHCLSMNCWRFGPEIFEACKNIEKSVRGELEITDAVMYTIEKLGQKYHNVMVSAPVLDLSSRGDIASVVDQLKGSPVQL
ncbi:MAG: nucleotidyltransferase family protein [Phycisphaerae bacterium]|nr:nucleotidyltransferase family protein [Phycisphaerae bacterium]